MINLVSSSEDNLCKRLVVVDGIPGCGKTMLSSIVSSFADSEIIKYSYEIENFCHLHDFRFLDLNTAGQLVKNQLNLLIYNSMMGRDMNFRYADISSVFQNINRLKNIRRIFAKGDEVIPGKIAAEKPILHLATHGLTGISEPLFRAMSEGMLFINMLRHPMFLLRQNIWNMQNLINNQRSFWLYYKHEGESVPYFYHGREALFAAANPKEKAIYFIEWFIDKQRNKPQVTINDSYYELTFESLVLDPQTHIDAICAKLQTKPTAQTAGVLKKENIPRKILSDGRKRKIYKRVGWVKSQTASMNDEYEETKRWAFDGISGHAAETLERLSAEYEAKHNTRHAQA